MYLEPRSKRRKTGRLQTLPMVIGLLWKIVGAQPQETLIDYSSTLQYVPLSII